MAIWTLIIIATVVSMVIAENMARGRAKVWVWIAIVGPLSALALYALGNRLTSAP